MFFLIDDPQFQYPDSKNPYAEKLAALQPLAFANHDSEKNRSQWQSQFSDHTPKPLHVEIGCNGGHVALGWAAQNPEIHYLGLDYKYKQIHRAAEKAQKKSLKNIIFIRGHASRMPFLFSPEEIDTLYLFFPDPWPKKRHHKNRFFQEAELRKLHPLLKKNGIFEIRTDHCGYFEWMLQEVAKVSDLFEKVEVSFDKHAGNAQALKLEIPDVTLFEKLFIKDGQAVHLMKLRRL